MAEGPSDLENVTPIWVHELENRIQFRKQKLGHEIGAGAKCFSCKDACPGLELHFWRKKCKNCKCGQEAHDVPEDDEIRFQILFKDSGNSSKFLAARAVLEVRVKEKAHKNVILQQFGDSVDVTKPMAFDWVPYEASPALAAAYMNELPSNKMPISGSDGAKYRKIQLKKQIPLHDLMNEECENFTPDEKKEYDRYMEKLRKSVGIGRIQRIKQVQYVEESQACNMQAAQSTGSVQELNKGLRNINIARIYEPGAGFRPIRPLPMYVEASPRTAMRTLPRTIPGSILRVPSAFKPKSAFEQPAQYNDSMLSVNNNPESSLDTTNGSYLGDNEDTEDTMNISGVSPLCQTPSENGRGGDEASQDVSLPTTSTPVGIMVQPDLILTPSRYAEKMTRCENQSSQGPTDNEGRSVVSSDLENANSQVGRTPDAPENETEDHLVDKSIECVDCKKVIQFNSVAVLIEKNGQTMAWHPNCFTCNDCKELLVDLVYFYHKGSVYCARHYAEMLKIQRCTACDELIFVREFTMAEGQFYHVNHFCCAECDLKLANNSYVHNDLKGNQPTCLDCYEKLYAERCLTCGVTVKGGEQGIKMGQMHWHATPNCFKCSYEKCSKSLVNEKFMMHNLKPYCSKKCQFASITPIKSE